MVTIWQRGATAALTIVMVGGCGAATDLVEAESEPTETPTTTPTPTSPTTPPPTTPATPAVAKPKVGECRRTNPLVNALGASTEIRRPVACRETHNAQTYFVGLMNQEMQRAAGSGNANRLHAEVAGICGRQLSGWLGGTGEDVALSVFDFIVGAPGPNEVGPNARWFSCDLYAIRAQNGLKLVRLSPTTRGILRSNRANAWDRCNRGSFKGGSTNIVVCTRPHTYRAVSGVYLDDPKYPGSKQLDARLESTCLGRVRAYLNTTAGFDYGFTWPSGGQWDSGDRWGICFHKTSS